MQARFGKSEILRRGSLKRLLLFLCALAQSAALFADDSNVAPETNTPTLPVPAILNAQKLYAQLEGYPLEEDPFNRLMIGVHVNGVGPFPFILDTGASRSIIYRSLTAALKLEAIPNKSRNIITVNGYKRALVYPIGDIFALGATLEIEDTVALPDILGSSARGLIGVDLLAGRTLVLRPSSSLALLMDNSDKLVGPNWTSVQGRPVAYGSLALSIDIGGVTIPVVVDTGASDTVINKAGAETLLRSGRGVGRAKTMAVIARGHAVAREKLILPTLMLGGASFEHAEVFVADLNVFRLLGAGEVPAIILGMNVLGQQDFAIDFENWRLYLRTEPDADIE